MFVWLTLPEEIATSPDSPLLKAALKEGVLYIPGEFGHVSEDRRRAAERGPAELRRREPGPDPRRRAAAEARSGDGSQDKSQSGGGNRSSVRFTITWQIPPLSPALRGEGKTLARPKAAFPTCHAFPLTPNPSPRKAGERGTEQLAAL